MTAGFHVGTNVQAAPDNTSFLLGGQVCRCTVYNSVNVCTKEILHLFRSEFLKLSIINL